MQISVGPFEISLSRKAAFPSAGKSIDSDDLQELNESTLAALRAMPDSELASRVDAISFDYNSVSGDASNLQNTLDREGVVVIKNFFDDHKIAIARKALEKLESALDAAASSVDGTFEDSEILVQSKNPKVTGYQARVSHPKVVVRIREGADEGMIDVFNFDRLAGDEAAVLRDPFCQSWLVNALNTTGSKMSPQNLNLYLNRSITKTRGFHVDTHSKKMKAFAYLSDVKSLDDGPYCFVRKSVRDDAWRRANLAITSLTNVKTESPFVDLRQVTPILAPRGSLVVSDQSGFHRGVPQAANHERQVLVMSYD